MIPSSFSACDGPPIILFLAFTGVPESELSVGAGAVGAGEVRGALYTSLF